MKCEVWGRSSLFHIIISATLHVPYFPRSCKFAASSSLGPRRLCARVWTAEALVVLVMLHLFLLRAFYALSYLPFVGQQECVLVFFLVSLFCLFTEYSLLVCLITCKHDSWWSVSCLRHDHYNAPQLETSCSHSADYWLHLPACTSFLILKIK